MQYHCISTRAELRAKAKEKAALDAQAKKDEQMRDSVNPISIRKFEQGDQESVVDLFCKGLTSYRVNDLISRLQCWFIQDKLKVGGDMHDIYSYFLSPGDHQDEASDRCFWVATSGERSNIVGCVGCKKYENRHAPRSGTDGDVDEEDTCKGDNYLELIRMSVSDSYRGMGIGSQLVSTLEHFGKLHFSI